MNDVQDATQCTHREKDTHTHNKLSLASNLMEMKVWVRLFWHCNIQLFFETGQSNFTYSQYIYKIVHMQILQFFANHVRPLWIGKIKHWIEFNLQFSILSLKSTKLASFIQIYEQLANLLLPFYKLRTKSQQTKQKKKKEKQNTKSCAKHVLAW